MKYEDNEPLNITGYNKYGNISVKVVNGKLE